LLEATAIDVGNYSQAEIARCRDKFAEELPSELGPEHHPDVHAWVSKLQSTLQQTTPQLFIQSLATFEVIDRVINYSAAYLSLRWPEELGRFDWVIDAKEPRGATDWETWWTEMIGPVCSTWSFRRRSSFMLEDAGADYSHMARFLTEIPDYQQPEAPTEPHDVMDLGMILSESRRFSATAESGLELADIAASALRRGIQRRLDRKGWKRLNKLIVARRDRTPLIQQLLVLPRDQERYSPLDAFIERWFTGGGRPILPSVEMLDCSFVRRPAWPNRGSGITTWHGRHVPPGGTPG
jgi:hypothetical protein